MTETMEVGLVGAGAAIVGGLISGAYQHFRDWLTRPKLKLDFDPADDKMETFWEGRHPFNGILLRASVRNEGNRPVLNCQVFLTALKNIHTTGESRTSFKDPQQIAWAGWSFDPKRIPHGVTFYVDVARVSKHEPGWQFTFERGVAEDLTNFKGTYRFKLVAVADNAEPAYLDLDTEYFGDWHNLRAWRPGT